MGDQPIERVRQRGVGSQIHNSREIKIIIGWRQIDMCEARKSLLAGSYSKASYVEDRWFC
jgi:hypothetical protein